jgi:solute carrier family 25 protein 38
VVSEYIVSSNVPGIALYFTSLSQFRGFMATSPLFSAVQKRDPERQSSSVLPVLTGPGNLLAGATTRVAAGFALNPFSVLKARYEVRKSLRTSFEARSFMTRLFFLLAE